MSLLIALLAFLFVGLKALECLSGVLAAFAGNVAVFDGAINRALAFVQCSSLQPVFFFFFGDGKKIRTPCTPWRRFRLASF